MGVATGQVQINNHHLSDFIPIRQLKTQKKKDGMHPSATELHSFGKGKLGCMFRSLRSKSIFVCGVA